MSLDARRYTYNQVPNVAVPPPTETGGLEPKPPTPAVSAPVDPNWARGNVAGSAVWDRMKNLPDAYKYAMYQAMVGRGRGQNDLMGVVQHNMFGGDMNAMNQWLNYWGQTNASSQAQFNPETGKFWGYDTGHDLNRAQYTRHLNEFGTGVQGTGERWERSLADLGQTDPWSQQGLSRIGTVPWYGHVGAPPGQSEQFYATPVGTSPYTGEWGNPAAGASSFNGPVGGGYLQPNTGVHAPGYTAPAVPTPRINREPTDRIQRDPGAPVMPNVTAPGGPSTTNPFQSPYSRQTNGYRFNQNNWR